MWPHASVHVHWSIHIRACDVLKCRCVCICMVCVHVQMLHLLYVHVQMLHLLYLHVHIHTKQRMLHNAQWLTRSQIFAHHTALFMPQPPITKTRSPWTTADMDLTGRGSDGPLCQVFALPSNT